MHSILANLLAQQALAEAMALLPEEVPTDAPATSTTSAASAPMDPSSSRSSSRSSFSSSPFSAPGSVGARSPSPDDRLLLVEQLRNRRHRFEPEQIPDLLTVLSTAAPALRWLIHLPPMVWCTPGETIPKPEASGEDILLLASTPSDGPSVLQAVLTRDIKDQQRGLPAHLPARHTFGWPTDIFDAIVRTLQDARQPGRASARQAGQSPTGTELRQALAAWLETPQGRASPLPPVRSEPAQVSEPATSSPLTVRPGPQARAATPVLQPVPAPLVPATPTELLRTRALALADVLRQGQWSPVLERLAPQLLARLPPEHDMYLERTEIRFANGVFLAVHDGHMGPSAHKVQCEAGSSDVIVARRSRLKERQTLCGREAYLMALSSCLRARTATTVQMRNLLADLIERHPVVAMLALAIFERWPDRDPEVLLRFCLHGKTLQPAGAQLLDPSLEQRNLTGWEVRSWQYRPLDVRLNDDLTAEEGVSVVDAKWHFSPLGPSVHGMALLHQYALRYAPPQKFEEARRFERLKDEFPRLRYEFGSLAELSRYLCQSPIALMSEMGTNLAARANRFVEELEAASVLEFSDAAQEPSAGPSQTPRN